MAWSLDISSHYFKGGKIMNLNKNIVEVTNCYGEKIKIIEVFGKEINIGDYVLFYLRMFTKEDNPIIPIGIIKSDGIYTCDKHNSYNINEFGFGVVTCVYVYKIPLGEFEKEAIRCNCDYDLYLNSNRDKLSYSGDLCWFASKNDLLLRKNDVSDLVLFSKSGELSEAQYNIVVGEYELFNGRIVQKCYIDYYYIITNPTEEEKKIKERLIQQYKKIVYNSIHEKNHKPKIGDLLYYNNTYYMYLGYVADYDMEMELNFRCAYNFQSILDKGLCLESILEYWKNNLYGLEKYVNRRNFKFIDNYNFNNVDSKELGQMLREARALCIECGKKELENYDNLYGFNCLINNMLFAKYDNLLCLEIKRYKKVIKDKNLNLDKEKAKFDKKCKGLRQKRYREYYKIKHKRF